MPLRYITAGESHGPQLTVLLEGMPAGLQIQSERINEDLARRQIKLGAGGRMAIETDKAEITAGIMEGRTIGAPIAIQIKNKDFFAWKNKEIPAYTIPRPGHADLAAVVKYHFNDIRCSLERSSARETASRVAMGAICRIFLESFDISLKSKVRSLGGVEIDGSPESMSPLIHDAKMQGETLGGVIECEINNLPIGLGSYVSADKRLDARLGAAILGIQAMKGIEIGPAFENTAKIGSKVHDAITAVGRETNNCGGLEGGMTTGQPLVFRVAMKPIPTTITPQKSIDLLTGKPTETCYERSDFCPVPRACVVVESMAAFVIADALIEKLGGDSISEMKTRYSALPTIIDNVVTGGVKVFWS